jgi:uncharacterized membrane protein
MRSDIFSGSEVIVLLAKFTVINPVIFPMVVGIVPERLLFDKLIAVIVLPLQLIPCQEQIFSKSHRLLVLVHPVPLVELNISINALH